MSVDSELSAPDHAARLPAVGSMTWRAPSAWWRAFVAWLAHGDAPGEAPSEPARPPLCPTRVSPRADSRAHAIAALTETKAAVRGEMIRAVEAGVSRLAGDQQALETRASVRVRLHAAASIVDGRNDRDRLRTHGHVEEDAVGCARTT